MKPPRFAPPRAAPPARLAFAVLCALAAASGLRAQEADEAAAREAAPNIYGAPAYFPGRTANDEILADDPPPTALQKTGDFFKGAGRAIGGYFARDAKAPTSHLEPAFTGFGFSLGLTGVGVYGATDLPFGALDFFSPKDNDWKKDKRIVIDLAKLARHGALDDGADLSVGANVRRPVKFEFGGKRKRSGFGFSLADLEARFDLNLNKDIFTALADGIPSGTFEYGATLSGAVFMESLAVNWHRRQIAAAGGRPLFVSVTAAHYVPLAYIPRSAVNVELQNGESISLTLNGTAAVFLPYNVIEPSKSASPDWGGIDASVQLEYALFPIFDLGLSLIHIPLVPATLHTKVDLTFDGTLFHADNLIDKPGEIITGEPQITTGNDSTAVKWAPRPLRVDLYALFRPFRTDLFVLRPDIGFTVLNPSERTAFNMGLQADLNITRVFTLSVFNGAQDGLWRSRLGLEFRFGPVARLSLAAESRSPSYAGAWSLKGAGAEVALTWGGGSRGLTNF